MFGSVRLYRSHHLKSALGEGEEIGKNRIDGESRENIIQLSSRLQEAI